MPLQIPLQFVEFIGSFLKINGKAVVTADRAVNTTAPLAGGGDLSADRTLSITLPLTAANTHASPSADTHHTGFVGLVVASTDVPPDANDKVTLVAGANVTLTPSGSQVTIASSAGGGSAAVKLVTTSDQTINNDGTLTADAELSTQSIGAGETWTCFGTLVFESGTTPDFRIKITGSGGGLVVRGAVTYVNLSPATVITTLSTVTVSISGHATDLQGVHFSGTVRNPGAGAETLQVQWAQDTATVANTILYRGSFIQLDKV